MSIKKIILITIFSSSSTYACNLSFDGVRGNNFYKRPPNSGFFNSKNAEKLSYHHIIPMYTGIDNGIMQILNYIYDGNTTLGKKNANEPLLTINTQLDSLLANQQVAEVSIEDINQTRAIITELMATKQINGAGDSCFNSEQDKLIVSKTLSYMPANGYLGPGSLIGDPGKKFDTYGKYFLSAEAYTSAVQLASYNLSAEHKSAETQLKVFNLVKALLNYTIQPYKKDLWMEDTLGSKICLKDKWGNCAPR